MFGNAYAEAEPIKGLVVRTNFGINYYNATDYIFSPKWKEGDKQSEVNSLQTTMGMSYDWVWSNTINYNRTIGVHTFGILAGMESKEHYEEALWGRKEGFAIEDIDYRYLDAGEGNATTGNGASAYYLTIWSPISERSTIRSWTVILSRQPCVVMPLHASARTTTQLSFLPYQPVGESARRTL